MIQLIQNSTIHGVSHIASSTNKIWKAFWFLLLFSGIVGIFVNIVFVIIKYLSHPILLSHTIEFEPYVWPEITFCNPSDPFMFKENSAALKYWLDVVKQTKDLSRLLANKSEVFKIVHGMRNTDFELEERTLAMATADPRRLMASYSLKDFLSIGVHRAVGGLFFVRGQKDGLPSAIKDDLSSMFSTKLVQIRNNIPCYTFHIEKSKISRVKFVDTLYFSLKFNDKSYEIFNSSYTSRSIFVYINNRNELPQEDEIILYPGFKTTLILTQIRRESSGVKRKCRNSRYKVELYDAYFQSTRVYEGGYKDCRKVVSQELFVKNCNCYSPFLPIYKNESGFPRLCLNATYFSKSEVLKNAQCMTREFRNYEKNQKKNTTLIDKCIKYRPKKCKIIGYKVDHSDHMQNELWTKSMNEMRKLQFKNSVANLGIKTTNGDYFQVMRDTLMDLIIMKESQYGELYKEDDEYPFSELLSDIGGLMGLWLGMSIVGLFEVAEMFYRYLIGMCKAARSKHLEANPQNV